MGTALKRSDVYGLDWLEDDASSETIETVASHWPKGSVADVCAPIDGISARKTLPNVKSAGTTQTEAAVVDFHITKSVPEAEWYGQVISVHDDYFVAELRGKHGIGVHGSLEEADIPLDEVSDSDKDLLVEGAFFSLCVGYEIKGQTRKRMTQVTFRRLPAYRRDEIEQARARASELVRALRVE